MKALGILRFAIVVLLFTLPEPAARAWVTRENGTMNFLSSSAHKVRIMDEAVRQFFFTPTGDVVAVGYLEETFTPNPDHWGGLYDTNLALVRYARANGSRLWRSAAPYCSSKILVTVSPAPAVALPNGDIVSAGRCRRDIDYDGDLDGWDYLFRFDVSSGAELWRIEPFPLATYGPNYSFFQYPVPFTPEDSLVVYNDLGAVAQRIAKVDLSSATVVRDLEYAWQQSDGLWLGTDLIGNPSILIHSDTQAIRVSEADGSILSTVSWIGARPNGLVQIQDSAGNLISADDPAFDPVGQTRDIDIGKRSLTDGALLWLYETRGNLTPEELLSYNPGGFVAMGVDGDGNVIAVGQVVNQALPTDDHPVVRGDALAVKLDADTGAEIWRTEISTPVRSFTGVAVAPNGDVVVAAWASDQNTTWPLIVKLSGGDGHELWRRKTPPISSPSPPYYETLTACDMPSIKAIAIDPASGNIAVGGTECNMTSADWFVQLFTSGGGDAPCGDGVVDVGEACDDGNGEGCDGCSADCRQIESGSLCGDGLTNPFCGEECDDLGNVDGDGCSADCQEEALPESIGGSLDANSTLSTDTEGDGATPADPVETSLTTPIAGDLGIEETSNVTTNSLGFSLLSQQINITAPKSQPEDPLVIVFTIDGSRIPAGETPDSIALLKDGVPVSECRGAAGVAEPDPCVSARATLTGGDAGITILSSTASDWNPGAVATVVRLPVRGSRMTISDDTDDATKRKLRFELSDLAIAAVDPTCSAGGGGGARLEVFSVAGGGKRITLDLPCENWSPSGKAEKFKGYRYKDSNLLAGPCKSAALLNPRKPGKDGKIKVTCSGGSPALPLDYDLTDEGEYVVGTTLEVGPVTFCAYFPRRFGPEDDPDKYDNAVIFKAQEVAAPAGCWLLD